MAAVFPLKEAYEFARARGLQIEIEAIQEETAGYVLPSGRRIVSSLRRGKISTLFKERGILEEFLYAFVPREDLNQVRRNISYCSGLVKKHSPSSLSTHPSSVNQYRSTGKEIEALMREILTWREANNDLCFEFTSPPISMCIPNAQQASLRALLEKTEVGFLDLTPLLTVAFIPERQACVFRVTHYLPTPALERYRVEVASSFIKSALDLPKK